MESRNAWFNISPEVMMTSFRATIRSRELQSPQSCKTGSGGFVPPPFALKKFTVVYKACIKLILKGFCDGIKIRGLSIQKSFWKWVTGRSFTQDPIDTFQGKISRMQSRSFFALAFQWCMPIFLDRRRNPWVHNVADKEWQGQPQKAHETSTDALDAERAMDFCACCRTEYKNAGVTFRDSKFCNSVDLSTWSIREHTVGSLCQQLILKKSQRYFTQFVAHN